MVFQAQCAALTPGLQFELAPKPQQNSQIFDIFNHFGPFPAWGRR
jgi:hypothetical protein